MSAGTLIIETAFWRSLGISVKRNLVRQMRACDLIAVALELGAPETQLGNLSRDGLIGLVEGLL